MADPEETIGSDCTLNRNSGAYGSPSWVEVTNVQDLSILDERGVAEAEVRDKDFVLNKLAKRTLGIDVTLLRDKSDASFVTFRDAYYNKTTLDVWAADGAAGNAGSEGLRIPEGIVTRFQESEPTSEFTTVEISIRPVAGATNDPEWFIIST